MAEFYKGFAFEWFARGDLTVEGVPICKTGRKTAARLRKLAREYIDRSTTLECRRRSRRSILDRLRDGRVKWNAWRRKHPEIHPMLANAKTLHRVFKGRKGLEGYDFSYTNFTQANLSGLNLRSANFHQAILAKANLSRAKLQNANFCRTDFYETNFRGAWLNGANLQGVQLTKTDLAGADLSDCNLYGLSAWDLLANPGKQKRLRIAYQALSTGSDTPETAIVDSVDLAAFIYMTLNNRNIKRVFEETGEKWVLLLGRFGARKRVLERLRSALRDLHYVPIVFDFSRPSNRDLVETAVLLAGMSAFVIVDVTDPRSTPMELQAIAPAFGVPIAPILQRGHRTFATFTSLRKVFWVLPTFVYRNPDHLVDSLRRSIIRKALDLREQLKKVKRGDLTLRTAPRRRRRRSQRTRRPPT